MLWEEMTAKEFEKAVIETEGICIIPFGVIEKHGNHLPLNTDIETARWVAKEAVKIEPAVIFPNYYFGQIAEALHVPGTISIPHDLMFKLLDEVCNEISRNGFKKIVILNGHGGNNAFVQYFIQSSLRVKKDYVVYSLNFDKWINNDQLNDVAKILGTDDLGEHAGNYETSLMMVIRPDLVRMEHVEIKESQNLKRMEHLTNNGIYTGISWYAGHPYHFAGDPLHSMEEAGEKALEISIQTVAKGIGIIKRDKTASQLQNEFFSRW
jgi:creatinine amidohydrolase